MFEIGEEFKCHPNFIDFEYILMMFIEVREMHLSSQETQYLAKLDREASIRNPDIRFAVVTDAPIVFGMARMWQSYYDDTAWQIMVFQDLEKARSWLSKRC